MADRRPENFWEVLLGAAGTGAKQIGQTYAGGQQQERQNKLSALMMALQMGEAQRDQEMHRQRIALGRANLSLVNQRLATLATESAKTNEQRVAEEADLLGARLTELGKLDIPGGTTAKMGDLTYTAPQLSTPKAPQLGAVDRLLLKHMGEPAFVEYKTREGAAAKEKTRSAQDIDVRAAYRRDYPKDIAEQFITWYDRGENPNEDAKKDYDKMVNALKGGEYFARNAKPEDFAQAAATTGVSPLYGKTTLFGVLAGYAKQHKRGTLNTKEYIKKASAAIQHFENLYSETLKYFQEFGTE